MLTNHNKDWGAETTIARTANGSDVAAISVAGPGQPAHAIRAYVELEEGKIAELATDNCVDWKVIRDSIL